MPRRLRTAGPCQLLIALALLLSTTLQTPEAFSARKVFLSERIRHQQILRSRSRVTTSALAGIYNDGEGSSYSGVFGQGRKKKVRSLFQLQQEMVSKMLGKKNSYPRQSRLGRQARLDRPRWSLPRRVLVLLFCVATQFTILTGGGGLLNYQPPVAHATTSSSIGLLQQAWPDLPRITMNNYYSQSPPPAGKVPEAKATTATWSASTAPTAAAQDQAPATSRILTAAGTVLLALAVGLLVGKSLLSGSRRTGIRITSSEDLKKTPAAAPVVATTDDNAALDDAVVRQIREDFTKIQKKVDEREARLEKAKYLMSQIDSTVKRSSSVVSTQSSTSSASTKKKALDVKGDYTGLFDEPLVSPNKRLQDEKARAMVKEMLAQVEEAEGKASIMKEQQDSVQQEFNKIVEQSKRDPEPPIPMPPPLEETEFANWTQALDEYVITEEERQRVLRDIYFADEKDPLAYIFNKPTKYITNGGLSAATSSKNQPIQSPVQKALARMGNYSLPTTVTLPSVKMPVLPNLPNAGGSLSSNFTNYPPYLGYTIPSEPKPKPFPLLENLPPPPPRPIQMEVVELKEEEAEPLVMLPPTPPETQPPPAAIEKLAAMSGDVGQVEDVLTEQDEAPEPQMTTSLWDGVPFLSMRVENGMPVLSVQTARSTTTAEPQEQLQEWQ